MKDLYSEFLKNGYSIQKIEDMLFFDALTNQIKERIGCGNLEEIHNIIDSREINNIRIKCFRDINSNKNWEKRYFSIASNSLTSLLGPDLSIQSKLNLSIQQHLLL